jgi:hypothetical protein
MPAPVSDPSASMFNLKIRHTRNSSLSSGHIKIMRQGKFAEGDEMFE